MQKTPQTTPTSQVSFSFLDLMPIAELILLLSLLLCAGINRKMRPCVCSFASWSDLWCLHLVLTLASCSVPAQFMKCNWIATALPGFSWWPSVFKLAAEKQFVCLNPQLVSPSSMGNWISLLLWSPFLLSYRGQLVFTIIHFPKTLIIFAALWCNFYKCFLPTECEWNDA